ncbi:aminoacylase-1-like [Cimex lectularius]|uniref:N-acyl-aliphatic-L-amino acid amidohydrolase n=1 Tax=Cimex lectularius TaxID=79782 RepID=A0A8I6TGS8_CIMLE|nr:aminoacylase-1-like [Cimex lectularius]
MATFCSPGKENKQSGGETCPKKTSTKRLPTDKLAINEDDEKMTEHVAVKNFREYLRIPSVQPNVNYDGCVDFLKRQAKALDLPVRVFVPTPAKPVVIITWLGLEPSLPSLLLNSHMDVVPVFPEKWTHDPFGAEKDANGNIYARGAQDMKCVGIQYIEAVRRLKESGVRLRRTIHMSFVPDEEIGGEDGMGKWVLTDDFRSLNVGCALDEGMASVDETYLLFYGERSIWQVHIHCQGTPGHGSLLLPETAGEKMRRVVDAFMDLRATEKKKLETNPKLTIGDVTTINLTRVKGGVQNNVVPPELVVGFDCRLSPTTDLQSFEKWILDVCEKAGKGVYPEFQQKQNAKALTRLDKTNPYWVVFKKECDKLGLKLREAIFPGGTDSRFVRDLGIPAFGFSPMNKTPVLLHDHDEFLSESTFLTGLDIYTKLIPALANS